MANHKKLLLMGFTLLLAATGGFANDAHGFLAAKKVHRNPSLKAHHSSWLKHAYTLPPFTVIKASDNININVVMGKSHRTLQAAGPEPILIRFRAEVQGHTLKLYLTPPKHLHGVLSHDLGTVAVSIHLPRLYKIIHDGDGDFRVTHLYNQNIEVEKDGDGNLAISGNQIHLRRLVNYGDGHIRIRGIQVSNLLLEDYGDGSIHLSGKHIGLRYLKDEGAGDLWIDNASGGNLIMDVDSDGLVKLTGVLHIAQIRFAGDGTLRIYWVDSPVLRIEAEGSGTVLLAGVANVVDAKVYGTTDLDIRYLRAKTVFVKTEQESAAYVYPRINLFALAMNRSDIYYFNQPIFVSKYMRQYGSILSMHRIPQALLKFDATV